MKSLRKLFTGKKKDRSSKTRETAVTATAASAQEALSTPKDPPKDTKKRAENTADSKVTAAKKPQQHQQHQHNIHAANHKSSASLADTTTNGLPVGPSRVQKPQLAAIAAARGASSNGKHKARTGDTLLGVSPADQKAMPSGSASSLPQPPPPPPAAPATPATAATPELSRKAVPPRQPDGDMEQLERTSPSAAVAAETAAPLTEEQEASLREKQKMTRAYDLIPIMEQTKLPRGGVSVETKSVGRIQFGIPPETIKDSMRLGIPVPQIYIVPVERFSREIGPALGVNLAEFEFPGYFNFFIKKKQCTLIVDSKDAEENIRRVFGETLLGPAKFRRDEDPVANQDEDFATDFPREARPNFAKELKHFRTMPGGKELVIETLLEFTHFLDVRLHKAKQVLGVLPDLSDDDDDVDVALSMEGSHHAAQNHSDDEAPAENVPENLEAVETREEKTSPWTYLSARNSGDVATVWPPDATPEQIKARSVPRAEVFKMPGGTEYIIHDVDENNVIVGKARLSGHVKVSDRMSVEGFGGRSMMDDVNEKKKTPNEEEESEALVVNASVAPPSFHPPSFGVTILGNSHGFDASGSVSGYVLWINGRGVMIDPPPYSSATLEREGIRPRTIVGIILTHCHADHDAGAFQKVLTGSPVVVITTPTIYKSFIRKYAALSALSPALLRHSHRYKPAIIGQPLRFQGATFHFTYTLHSIPCVGFRVVWRGRSMVFTGDHLNSPVEIGKLQDSGVLTKARADDLRQLPLQDTDLLLHEAGTPPLHTQLSVLLELPKKVKDRLYVVHTSALPENCELRVAPTGTAGTLRLDQPGLRTMTTETQQQQQNSGRAARGELASSLTLSESGAGDLGWGGQNEYEPVSMEPTFREGGGSGTMMDTRFMLSSVNLAQSTRASRSASVVSGDMSFSVPLVSMRPASSTDAWFILNLLSAVPFLTSLSYASTMELLETAKVDAYSRNDVIVSANRRSEVLCVVWEGTCSERQSNMNTGRPNAKGLGPIAEEAKSSLAVWHAGDWTGPIALQPERRFSGESDNSVDHDIVAVSQEGVKVITVEFSSLHAILKTGSSLYRKYLARKVEQERARLDSSQRAERKEEQNMSPREQALDDAMRDLNVLELLNMNSSLRKLNAVQKRHLESLAEGPVSYTAGGKLWQSGTPVDKAFLVVSGTVSFALQRRPAGSAVVNSASEVTKHGDGDVGYKMDRDAKQALKELGAHGNPGDDHSSMSSLDVDDARHSHDDFVAELEQVGRALQIRAEAYERDGAPSGDDSVDSSMEVDSEGQAERGASTGQLRRSSSGARHANKTLARLYSRRAHAGGINFSRGHFLGDVSKMVAGLLAIDDAEHDDMGPTYGFGERMEGNGSSRKLMMNSVIYEEGDQNSMHTSTLTAGQDGCVVLVFPKSSLIPFLDEYPGLLLSLLGTQVVV